MYRWSSDFRISISLINFSRREGVEIDSFFTSLIAISLPVVRCLPSLTFPNSCGVRANVVEYALSDGLAETVRAEGVVVLLCARRVGLHSFVAPASQSGGSVCGSETGARGVKLTSGAALHPRLPSRLSAPFR